MPRVTEAHRHARREEFAEAALRVLRRNGVSNTSIAQIVEESGLSAGALYANFANKAELARYIAQTLFDWRIDGIAAAAAEERVRTPVAVMRDLLVTTAEAAPPIDVILQFWAESTLDAELREVLESKVGRLRGAFAAAVLQWAHEQEPTDPEQLADRAAATMVVLCQGYLAHRALLGWVGAEDYLETAELLFRSS